MVDLLYAAYHRRTNCPRCPSTVCPMKDRTLTMERVGAVQNTIIPEAELTQWFIANPGNQPTPQALHPHNCCWSPERRSCRQVASASVAWELGCNTPMRDIYHGGRYGVAACAIVICAGSRDGEADAEAEQESCRGPHASELAHRTVRPPTSWNQYQVAS